MTITTARVTFLAAFIAAAGVTTACGQSSERQSPTSPSGLGSGSASSESRPSWAGPPAQPPGSPSGNDGPPGSGGQNPGPGGALQTCNVADRSTEELIPGVTLTWSSSFHCLGAPNQGSYQVEVQVTSNGGSAESVRLDRVELRQTTPRPQITGATAQTTGVPTTIAPGGSASFTVSGNYTLVSTDEGNKLNIHLQAHGVGVSSARPFRLGINVHLRAAGATE